MYNKDKGENLSKEGAGRVGIYKATQLSRCYTLECNYNKIDYERQLPDIGPALETEETSKSFDFASNLGYKQSQSIFLGFFGLKEFWLIGKSIVISLLDLVGANEKKSRLAGTPFKTLQVKPNSLLGKF